MIGKAVWKKIELKKSTTFQVLVVQAPPHLTEHQDILKLND
jgi:hypothetical protein